MSHLLYPAVLPSREAVLAKLAEQGPKEDAEKLLAKIIDQQIGREDVTREDLVRVLLCIGCDADKVKQETSFPTLFWAVSEWPMVRTNRIYAAKDRVEHLGGGVLKAQRDVSVLIRRIDELEEEIKTTPQRLAIARHVLAEKREQLNAAKAALAAAMQ